jgi:hypothetical protein
VDRHEPELLQVHQKGKSLHVLIGKDLIGKRGNWDLSNPFSIKTTREM